MFGSNYNDSKLAMVLLTLGLNDKLKVPASPHSLNPIPLPFTHELPPNPSQLLPSRQGTKVKSVAVSPGAVASDIWRSFPRLYRTLVLDPAQRLLFLDNDQGSVPSVYAATQPLAPEAEADSVPYYEPYWTPGPGFLFPFEACGPFNGWTRVRPRLPPDALRVAKELWFLSERCLQQHGHA